MRDLQPKEIKLTGERTHTLVSVERTFHDGSWKETGKEKTKEVTSISRKSSKASFFMHVSSNSKNYFEILHLLIIILI